MSVISEALRAELQRLLSEATEFDVKTCVQIERCAKAAKAMLAATGGVANAMQLVQDQQEEGGGGMMNASGITATPYGALAPAPAAETFGVRAIQELIKLVPTLTKKNNPVAKKDDPLQLVRAIKEAKDAGLAEVAKALEQRLMSEMAPAEEAPEEPTPDDPVGTAATGVLVLGATPPTTSGAFPVPLPGVAPYPNPMGPSTFGEE